VNHFARVRGVLHAEGVPLTRIAEEVGTPTYVYARATLERHYAVVTEAFQSLCAPHLVCYSVKANSNLGVLDVFARLGSGFDIVSGGELLRVRAAGGDVRRVVFSGVGKTRAELEAAHAAGILLFNVESAEELEALDAVGRAAGRPAPFALRVNPEVDARTHPYIATGLKTSKFGVPFREAVALYARARKMKGLRALGVDCHIGSQLTDAAPVTQALTRVSELYLQLKAAGHPLSYLDVGGGLGITYSDERPPSPDAYARRVVKATAATGATLVMEPGRVLVGNAGLLLTRVTYRKRTPARNFVILDAGMNDLLRPALYGAHHGLEPVVQRRGGSPVRVDVVGPVCESTDVLAKGRRMALPRQGELFVLRSAGAYGMSMASRYNGRALPAEVLVDGDRYTVVRAREALEELWRGERVAPPTPKSKTKKGHTR
jgi:diaminopimelate decarboxylase